MAGGNYWATPNGSGYSETCEDRDNDGICDSNYTFSLRNVDHLPLAKYPVKGMRLWGYVYDHLAAGLNDAIVTAYWSGGSNFAVTYYTMIIPADIRNLTLTVRKDLPDGTYYWYQRTKNTSQICYDDECKWDVYLGMPIPELSPLILMMVFIAAVALYTWRKNLETLQL